MNIKYYINDLPDDIVLDGDIAIDTEAKGLHLERDRLCLVQFCDSNKKTYLVHFPDTNYNYDCPNLKTILLDPNRQKIFHFGRFDISIMRYYLNLKEIPNIYCTKIASRFARTYTESHGLKNLVGELLKIDLKKEQQSSNWGNEILSEAQKIYAANDVIYLHDLRNILTEMLKKTNRFEIVKKYFNFLNTICESDIIGFNEDMFRHHD